MHINEVTINPKAEKEFDVNGLKFKCLSYIPADKYSEIIIDSVSPLFYTIKDGEISMSDISQPPTKDEMFLLINEEIYFTVAFIKHLTNIEIPDDCNIYEAYDKLASHNIVDIVMEWAYAEDLSLNVRSIVDETINHRINLINAIRSKV